MAVTLNYHYLENETKITKISSQSCLQDMYMHFASLQNDLINCCNVSKFFIFLTNILFIIRSDLIALHFEYQIMVFEMQNKNL